jgi:acyl-CoA synthetase (AMP-forming)/AMP-acid ligase II
LEQGARVNEKDFTGKTALGFTNDRWEIDEALWGHPGVEDAVVIEREDHPGEKRMVVYYVGTEEPEALRGYLQTKLPEHMMSVVFMQLAALPLKPNAKVDRQALPVPERGGATWTYEAPRTPIKKLLTLSIR